MAEGVRHGEYRDKPVLSFAEGPGMTCLVSAIVAPNPALTLSLWEREGVRPAQPGGKGEDSNQNADQAGNNNPSFAIFSRHTNGASWWTLFPSLSTATVTGKSLTSNS